MKIEKSTEIEKLTNKKVTEDPVREKTIGQVPPGREGKKPVRIQYSSIPGFR